MRMFKYYGKMLLFVAVPVCFVVVTSIVLSLLFGWLGALASNLSFVECFKASMASGILEFILGIIAIIGTALYIDSTQV